MVHFCDRNGFQDMTENKEISIFGKLHFCNFLSSKIFSKDFAILRENCPFWVKILVQMVKTIALNDQNEILYVSVAQIVFEIGMSKLMDILTFEKMHSLTFFIKNVKVIDNQKKHNFES